MKAKISIILILFCAFSTLANGTLSPKNRGKKPATSEKKNIEANQKEFMVKVGPQKLSVFDKNLVSEMGTTQDILKNYQQFFEEPDEHKFEGLVLGYVTPWNNHGYDIAKIFGNKFTHISPVWLQVRNNGPKSYEVTGAHDIDKGWMADVRNAGRLRKTKIVPRVLFEHWTSEDYLGLMSNADEVKKLTATLIKFAKKHHFDGYVLEVWTVMASVVKAEPDALNKVWRQILEPFVKEELDIILAVHPKGKTDLFEQEHFEGLFDYITGISLMTYDFSSPKNPGPNAPLPWMEDSIKSLTSDPKKRRKILTGLNFYGNDYSENGGGAIIGKQYIEKLQSLEDRDLMWEPRASEHFLEYNDDQNKLHLVVYPTLYSIQKRLELAKELNTGISIWEIGQGLDYFYDLL